MSAFGTRLRRLSIRARLTIAFAISLVVVLALAAVFVYVRVDAALTESTDEALEARLDSLRGLISGSPPTTPGLGPTTDSEDDFSQILNAEGEVLSSTLPATAPPALDPVAAARAAEDEVLFESLAVEGVDGDARVLAGPAESGGRTLVVVTGTANQERGETLDQIAAAFAVGAPLALLLASGAGYLLARRALRPVEEMRARAEGISGEGAGERLPLPEAEDELRALATTLNSMLERLETALEREREFVADASHELRTPLSILKAELELADDEALDVAELRQAIGSARGEVDRLARLADDLLIAARADRGEIPIHREPIAVGELIGRVGRRFEAAIHRDGRRLLTEAPAGLVAEVDPLRLEQVIGNLIDNAVRHGEGTVRARAYADRDALVIDVGDEGSGFPPGFASSAFERFSRPDAGRSGAGAGLGLAIVRALAAAHGGSATIPEDGSATVRVTLPDAILDPGPGRG